MQKRMVCQKKNKIKVTLYSCGIATILWFVQSALGLNFIWTSSNIHFQKTWEWALIYAGIWTSTLILYWSIYSEKSEYSHILQLGVLPLGILTLFFSGGIKYYQYIMVVSFLIFEYWDLSVGPGIYDITDVFRMQRKKLFRLLKNTCFHNLLYILSFYSIIYFFAFLLPLYFNSEKLIDSDKEIYHATNVRDLCSTTGDNLWEDNKESLYQLRAKNLLKMDLQQCIDAHQELLNIECEFLGINPIELVVTDITGESIRGFFDGTKIVVDERYFIDSGEIEKNQAIYIILHEVYHYYSQECSKELEKMKKADINMELKFARDIQAWKENQENYHPGEEDFYLYQSQPLETAANEYAQKWYWNYLNFIYDWNEKNEEIESDESGHVRF